MELHLRVNVICRVCCSSAHHRRQLCLPLDPGTYTSHISTELQVYGAAPEGFVLSASCAAVQPSTEGSSFVPDTITPPICTSQPGLFCPQSVLHFSPAQKAALFASRRQYIADMERCSRQRRRLMQHMQSTPQAAPVDSIQLAASLNEADDAAQQLQDCVNQEHLLLVGYMQKSSLEVTACVPG